MSRVSEALRVKLNHEVDEFLRLPANRPAAYCVDTVRVFLEALRRGHSINSARGLARIHQEQLSRWRSDPTRPLFREAMALALAEGRAKLVERWITCESIKIARPIIEYLQRMEPEEYGLVQRVDLTRHDERIPDEPDEIRSEIARIEQAKGQLLGRFEYQYDGTAKN